MEDNDSINTLSGIGACDGIAEGVVKVVDGVQDASRFEEGDVLVAELTQPDMVAMMNKAAAIV